MKVLIIYYSYEGATELVSKIIAEKLDADLLFLEPEKPLMTSKGFMKFVWGGRQALMKVRPPLKEINIKFDDYDIIFFGTPVWSYTFTPPLRTFFDEYKLEGKKIVLFATHEGGLGKTLEKMEEKLEGNEIIGKGDFIVHKKDEEEVKKEILDWVFNLSL